ncbi:flagellar basal-body P-ring formation protein FlgA [Photobacterium aphoticum]|uniref:Flagella basal body P-ring formation protein FlgA n=1 Tax=Photobacterium aphoticum TaxID=754436 RepID=A0A090QX51_9GAMM|nr:flagellar basal-body P-ring formation protein FlgA [Photobacterium aphoticum]
MIQRTKLSFIWSFIGLSSIFFSTFISAKPLTSQEQVQHAAEQYVSAQLDPPHNATLHVEAAALDSRLKLTTCPTPLEASLPGKQNLSGNVTVLIRCAAPQWQVYVPVRTQLLLPRVVATRPLARGHVLTLSDLHIQPVELRFQRGISFEAPEQIIGARIKRNVQMGDAVLGNDICVVCRNDVVTIRAGSKGLSIMTKGVALSDGSLGEQVRVQNSKSKRIIDAVVTGVSDVSVGY